jgi:hypothetical protein
MKKFVLIIALIGFVSFGALSIQNVVASSSQVEMARFDKDPKKTSDKKAAESKNTKTTEVKSENADAKSTTSTCSDKSATSKGCCDKDKAGCCSSGPEKK